MIGRDECERVPAYYTEEEKSLKRRGAYLRKRREAMAALKATLTYETSLTPEDIAAIESRIKNATSVLRWHNTSGRTAPRSN